MTFLGTAIAYPRGSQFAQQGANKQVVYNKQLYQNYMT